MMETKAIDRLTGPWWWNNEPIDAEKEAAPQEAFFRLEFQGKRSDLTLRLALRGSYQFWLNGTRMGAGPARSSHGRLTVDEWNLPAELLTEENTVAIQVFWEGIFTFDQVRGTPGLWLSLQKEDEDIPYQWLVTQETGRIVTHRFSHQRGWVEEIDGSRQAQGWPQGDWESSQWDQPVLRNGDAPITLEHRDIKPYVKAIYRAQSLTFKGACDPQTRTEHRLLGYEGREGFGAPLDAPSRLIQEEALRPTRAVDINLAGLTASGQGTVVLRPDPDGGDRTLELDFGKFVSGTFDLCVEAPAGTVIDIGWSEIPWNEDCVSRWARSGQPGGSVPAREFCDARQGTRYRCKGGRAENFAGLFIAAFQQVRLAFRCPSDRQEEIRIHRLQVHASQYPVDREGDFHCSDTELNRIFNASVLTLENSTYDVFMDCPGRERGAWLNDSYWSGAGLLAVSGDVAFERRFLRQFIDSQGVIPYHGMTALLYPSEFHRWIGGKQRPILSHSLFWLLQVERHLRLFGDAALKESWKPGIEKLLGCLEGSRRPEGLIENTFWDDFHDWSAYESGPIQTASNFLYAKAMIQLGQFYENPGWIEKGKQTAISIESLAWNAGRELYADILVSSAGQLSAGTQFSEMTNYVALWSKLASKPRETIIWKQLRSFHPMKMDRHLFNYETNLVRSNLFALLYRFEYSGRRGESECLLRDLKATYLPMFERGQTTFSESLGTHNSLCHGFNGYVAYLSMRYLAGIELPENPGENIVIRPHPDLLSWCQSRTPWMNSHVQVWWSRSGDDLRVIASVPTGQTGELVIRHQAPLIFTDTLDVTITDVR